jgi:hypothetical protein
LTETQNLNLNDLKVWLERETSSTFVPIHTKAKKIRDEMVKSLDNLVEAAKVLLESSGKEVEKKNMKTLNRARALNKLAHLFIERIRKITVPREVSYDGLKGFAEETKKALLAIEADIRNFFPRISPFFILDRRRFQIVFERTKELLKDMTEFLSKEYIKTKTLEETFKLIDESKSLNLQSANLKQQIKEAENTITAIDNEIAEIKHKMTELSSKGGISQLSQIDAEIDTLNTELKSKLQHLQKPFIKLQSLATHGEGSGLTPEELGKLDKYVENPFEALATEPANYPLLRQILQKLNRLMHEDKLKLKPEKIRKAEQTINNIINQNDVASLYERCVHARMRRIQLLESAELAETKSDLVRLRGLIEGQERRRIHFESEKNLAEKAYTQTSDRIRNHKSQMEKNIQTFLGRNVRVE